MSKPYRDPSSFFPSRRRSPGTPLRSVHVCMCLCMYAWSVEDLLELLSIYACMRVRSCMYVCMVISKIPWNSSPIYACMHVCVYIYIHACIIYIHIYIHTQTYIYIRIYTYIYIHVQICTHIGTFCT